MSTGYSGNSTHDKNVNAAELAHQNSILAGASRATCIAADALFHRTAAKSALANNCGAEPFLSALRALGQSLYP